MSRQRKARPTEDTSRFTVGTGPCPRCGKASYRTRKDAKRAARRLFPNDRMSVYGCGHYYHVGHLPKVVRRGEASRAQVREDRYGL